MRLFLPHNRSLKQFFKTCMNVIIRIKKAFTLSFTIDCTQGFKIRKPREGGLLLVKTYQEHMELCE